MKGEVRKLKIRPLTFDDILVKDGLEAISTLTNREPYYLVGGMAAQSYIPSRCRRPTSDIDLSVVRPLNYEDFKSFSKPVAEYLLDNGYNVQTRKRPRAFVLEIENIEGDKMLVEFSRRNKKSFDNSKKKLERELENSRRKIMETKKSTYVVVAPEDIMVPKLARSVNSLGRRPELKKDIPKEIMSLSDDYVRRRLNFINRFREDAMLSPGDLELAEELRFISDIYDIRILSEICGINVDYFYDSANDWNILSREITLEKEKNILYNSTLPKLNDSIVLSH